MHKLAEIAFYPGNPPTYVLVVDGCSDGSVTVEDALWRCCRHNEDKIYDISAILRSNDRQFLKYIDMKLFGMKKKGIERDFGFSIA
jgi:hypothetical protein